MHVLGIDLAKASFDVTLMGADERMIHGTFPNTDAGYTQLQQWLIQQHSPVVHATMEATNVYWEALAQHLYDNGHTVSVVNPAAIKGFALSQLRRQKTDKLDSQTIALFCARTPPAAWTPPTPAQRKLRALARHREDLLHTRVQQEQRLSTTTDGDVRASIEQVMQAITVQVTVTERQMKALIAQHPHLSADMDLLTSIVGIAALTAMKLLAELGDIRQYESAKALAADAGVTPAHYESGTSIKHRPTMSKMGNATVRSALWWPAITAMRCCPRIKAFAQALLARGKPKKVVIGAVMRKLLHIIYGVITHQTPYDPSRV